MPSPGQQRAWKANSQTIPTFDDSVEAELWSPCLLGWEYLAIGCVSFLCGGKQKYWENWETVVLLKSSRLARRRFSSLIGGPAPRPPAVCSHAARGLYVGLWDPFWGRFHLPVCIVSGCLGWEGSPNACEELYLSNPSVSEICGIWWINLTNVGLAKELASLKKKKKKRLVFPCWVMHSAEAEEILCWASWCKRRPGSPTRGGSEKILGR